MKIATDQFEIVDGPADGTLWTYVSRSTRASIPFAPPVFEIEGGSVTAALAGAPVETAPPLTLGADMVEYRYADAIRDNPDLRLELIFRVAAGCPVVRFRYGLTAARDVRLTRKNDGDSLSYWRTSLQDADRVREIQLSAFNELVHSYGPSERELRPSAFENGDNVMGPLLTARQGAATLLFGYEHGSQVPDAFLSFRLGTGQSIELRAVKGNYLDGQRVGPAEPFLTPWFETAAAAGDETVMAGHYRSFVLNHLSRHRASRRPWIFYNTWAFQERNKWWNGQPYLASMNQERILREIDCAHEMGIDVFVLDTGWYGKTGDWQVDTRRFPDGLKTVRERLDRHGMKLGLWFAPAHAALSSRALQDHRDCLTSRKGKPSEPHEVWETEKSQTLCLVSRYGDALADELIRVSRELGATYFKWDAIQQYGCDAPCHGHGDESHSEDERAQSYAFQLPGALARIAEKVSDACPDAIVDFDVTEGGRCVGLQFLTAGKYFLVNNGPYFRNFNIPFDKTKPPAWSNVFVHPGPARGWIGRTPLAFDRWIPSTLFLTHYLPDDPAESQLINIASLLLGQNGIWGDLPAVSEAGVRLFGRLLNLYKHVRDDVTASQPVREGAVGSSPEIHEKIAPSGRGLVAAFASAPGCYRYTTAAPVAMPVMAWPDGEVTVDARGRACITWTFTGPGAKLVFFGGKPA